MKNNIEISVVIPSKDRLRLLRKAIPMYLEHEEVKEIIVVIDGSTDGTLPYLDNIAKTNPRVRYIDNGVNKGLPYSRNRGIEAAICDYIFSTEDDVQITNKDFFHVLIDHLNAYPADITGVRDIFKYEDESPESAIKRTNKIKGPAVNKKAIAVKTGMDIENDQQQYMLSSPMFGKAQVFKAVKFDENYKENFWREETDFQLTAQEMGYKLISCPHAITFNFVIVDDRSGVHAAAGLKRAKWIIKNNWYFINKHRAFISRNFNIGNRYIYITIFALRYILIELFVPTLAKVKRRILQIKDRDLE